VILFIISFGTLLAWLMGAIFVSGLDSAVTWLRDHVIRTRHSTQPLRDAIAAYDSSAQDRALAYSRADSRDALAAAVTSNRLALENVQLALHEIAPDLHSKAHASCYTMAELRKIAARTKY